MIGARVPSVNQVLMARHRESEKRGQDMSEVLAHVTRGELVESIHRGSIAVVRPDRSLVAFSGDPALPTYWRSAAKPIQALTVVTTGAADHFRFTDAELAVMCASHAGESFHREAVQSILDKIGLAEADLQCGTHAPVDDSVARGLAAAGLEPTPIYSNCSGKHAAMLAVSVHMGFQPQGYYLSDHPVQKLMIATVSDFCDTPVRDMELGIDGCGVPVFGLGLRAMALAYARLADPSEIKAEYTEAVERIVKAMQAYPEMISGAGRFTTQLIQAGAGEIVAKSGAEGVFSVGLRSSGLGVTVKVEDGSSRALPCIVLEVLRQLGYDLAGNPLLARFERGEVRNNRGELVGRIIPAFTLDWAASA